MKEHIKLTQTNRDQSKPSAPWLAVGEAIPGILLALLLLGSSAASLADTLFVANTDHLNIMEFDPSGAGNVFASTPGYYPRELAFDSAGNLYASYDRADASFYIYKYNSSGVGTLFATWPSGAPRGMAFDRAGNLYVVNIDDNAIIRFNSLGVGTVFASSGMSQPSCLTIDRAGNLYVANRNNTIMKYNSLGVGTVFANSGLDAPVGLAFDSAGDLYVASSANNTIMKFDSSGVGTVFANSGLDGPSGLAIDSAGSLYVANAYGNNIVKFNSSGVSAVFTSSGLYHPHGMAIRQALAPGLDYGLMAYYPLNGNANDFWGTNNGVIYGGVTPTQDRFGNPNGAYHFDGSASYIWIGEGLRPSNITACLWFKSLQSPPPGITQWMISDGMYGWGLIMGSPPGYTVPQGDVSLYPLYTTPSGFGDVMSAAPARNYNDGLWHFSAVTYDGIDGRLYVDGALKGVHRFTDSRGILYYSPGGLAIGGRHGPSVVEYLFTGDLDDARIYNRALSAAEVQSLYNVGAGQPALSNVRASQRAGTSLVDVWYDLSGASAPVVVSASISTDGGVSYALQPTHLTGDGATTPIGSGTSRHLVWDAGADLGAGYFPNTVVQVAVQPYCTSASGQFVVNLRGLSGGLTVNGQALDGTTGAPLAGALAQLGSGSATSDARGGFSFTSVAVGDYTLSVSKPGYTTASVAVSVTPGNSPSRVITLYPAAIAGSAPRVTSVTSKYPGFRYYLEGVPFSVQFTATVDWAGHPPGTVQFITTRKTYPAPANGSAVSQTLAMGADFGPNDRLRVVATSSDGAHSLAKQADLVVMPNPFPGVLALAWGLEDDGDDFSYNQTTTSPKSFIDAGVGNGIIPDDIPLFGGKGMGLQFIPEVTLKATSSDGVMQISLAWRNLEAGRLLYGDWKDGKITELSDCLTKFIDAGKISKSEVPQAGFGDMSLSLYPVLGGGWRYNADAGQWKWWDAELGVAGEFSIQQTWPFFAGPIPMFAKIRFDLPAQGTVQLQDTAPVSLNGEFNLNPSLRGSLGVGFSEVVSVEGWVEGGLGLDLQYPATPTVKDASVYAKAGATLYFLLHQQEWSLPPKSWDIYGRPLVVPEALLMQPSSDMHLLGRGYLNYPASGVMGHRFVKPMLFGSSGGGANPEVLMSPAFPFSDPNCSSSGTNCYLVFLEDNTNRTSLNRTMAMFSKYDGTMWALPMPLGDDGTADFHPRILTFADGSAVATWENEGTGQPTNATLSDMVSNLEVSVAWYSPALKAWVPARNMTTNYFLDRSPKLAGRTPDNVLLTWVSNPANDIDGSASAPNQIWSAQWNGTQWGSPQLAATVSNALVKYDLLYDGTNANLVLSVDMVGNSTNANGHELFCVVGQDRTWGALAQLTSDSTPDDNPQMAFDPRGNVVLIWLKGAELSSVVNFNMTNRQVVRTSEYSSNLADFKLANSVDGKLAVLWSEPSENDADLRLMLYDPIFRAWGAPKQLTHDPQAERSTTAVFYGTNEVIAVYDRSLVSSTNSADTTLSDLAAYYCTFSEDLALNANLFYCEPANPSPGGLAIFHAEALNLGDQFETNVVVAFYRDSVLAASEIGRVTLTNAIPPEGTNDFTFTWAVSSTNAPVTIFAVIDPDQKVLDASRSNNVARLDLVKPNTSIQEVRWSSISSNLLAITVRVSNDGAISNGPTTLLLNLDSVTGTNLFTQSIGTLAPGESVELSFLWDASALPDNVSVFAVLQGPSLSNNFSSANTTRVINIQRVWPPVFGDCQYLPDGSFQIAVYGELGRSYDLQVSTNLVSWELMLNFTCTNSPTIVVDPAATNHNLRFYRAVVP